MESLYLLIPISLVILAAGVGIFFWAVKSGQYDDIDREGDRILFDDDEPPPRPSSMRDGRAQGAVSGASGDSDVGERRAGHPDD